MSEIWVDILKAINQGKEVPYYTIDQYHELMEQGNVDPYRTYFITRERVEVEIPEKFHFRFNGMDFSNLLTVEEVKRPLASPTRNNVINNDFSNGSIFIGSKREPLYITVRFSYQQDNLSAIRRVLGGMLVGEELGELVFSDEPDLYYLAKIDGEADLDESYQFARGEITFFIPDGLAHDRNPVEVSALSPETLILKNKGTDYAYPVFDFYLKSKTYMVALISNERTYQYGQSLEGSPMKEVVYKIVEEEGYVPERHRAVLASDYLDNVLPSGWAVYDTNKIDDLWKNGGNWIPAKTQSVGSSNGKITISNNATHWQTGERMADWVKGNTYLVDGVKDINHKNSKKAYRLKNGNYYLGWLLEQDIASQTSNINGGLIPSFGTPPPYEWHGPSIHKNVLGKPYNYQLDVRFKFKLSKHSELGCLYFGAMNGDFQLFGCTIMAHKGNRTAQVNLVVRGKGLSFDKDPYGYFMKDFDGLGTFTKTDDRLTVTFINNLNGEKLTQSWNVPQIEKNYVTKLVVGALRYGNSPVPHSQVPRFVKFTGFDAEVWVDPNATVTRNFPDPPYVFEAGDVIRLDMRDNKAYVNGEELLNPIMYGSESIRIPMGEYEVKPMVDGEGEEKPDIDVWYQEVYK